MNKVQVEIMGLSSSPSSGGAYALLLKEVYGVRRLPIIIGGFEAQSIALELEGIKPPRPLTHDLIKSLIDNLGATVQEVVINELKENTFYAKITLEFSSLTTEIDARPSDAIAIAVRTKSLIYVSEDVMEAAAFVPTSEETNPEELADSPQGKEKEEGQQREQVDLSETKLAALQAKLNQALEAEDYERAAVLRDQINELRKVR
ncbi:MAG: bifunctional nuclease family protein [Chlorobi bacterium]|nr:bifunctional nuclease family protein [Chlorobiota bacterium]